MLTAAEYLSDKSRNAEDNRSFATPCDYVTGIEPDHLIIELHPTLVENTHYGQLAGMTLRCSDQQRPSSIALRLRYEQFLKRTER
jgi:hypothetical protein